MRLRRTTPERDGGLMPLAAEIDQNLQHIRDRPREEVADRLAGEIADGGAQGTAWERAELVLRLACRDVDLRGGSATISEDWTRVRIETDRASIDLGLGADVTEYIVRR